MYVVEIILLCLFRFCFGSYHEQYRVLYCWLSNRVLYMNENEQVPYASSDKWESYIFDDVEYIVQNIPVTWENAKILCRGHHNGSLVTLDTKEKADFLAEVLSESQFTLDSVWTGAHRDNADDPGGYRWSNSVELRRTAFDVLGNEQDDVNIYPLWLNRTHVPVPEGGADCVALERVRHDKPVFLDLPCLLERPFTCQREIHEHTNIVKLQTVRCRTGLYHVYDGRLNWHQAAAYCVLHKFSLANIATMKCLKKLGMTMLKTRPSIEGAWVGATGKLGKWTWIDSGLSIFQPSPYIEDAVHLWPPMRDSTSIKQNGCLQLDRHASHPPVFLEARCERKMQFICYEGISGSSLTRRTATAPPNDDLFYYILVRQKLFWEHALDYCMRMKGSLASIENNDILIQLLLLMGENKDEPVEHIWISGRLNLTKNMASDGVSFAWYNPNNNKRIPEPRSYGRTSSIYMMPWLDEDFNMDNPCLNLDRQDHLNGLVYGLPCDTPQYSICMIEKNNRQSSPTPIVVASVESSTEAEIAPII